MSLSPEILEQRKRAIGGSDAGAVAGLNPYRTAFDVWLDKTGRADEIEDNEAMYWGRALEDTVARVYAERTGHKIRRKGMIFGAHPWMAANLDRVIVGDPRGPGVLEIKTASHYTADRWGESGSDQIPDEYLAQVAHYLAVTGYTWARLAVLIGGRDFRIYDLPRDDDLIAALIDIEGRFWRHYVETDTPPPPEAREDFAKRWPRDSGETIQADASIIDACKRLAGVKDDIKVLQDTQKDLEQVVKGYMANAATLVDTDGKPLATWKTQTSRRLDTKAIKEASPELAAEFTVETDSRVFRLK